MRGQREKKKTLRQGIALLLTVALLLGAFGLPAAYAIVEDSSLAQPTVTQEQEGPLDEEATAQPEESMPPTVTETPDGTEEGTDAPLDEGIPAASAIAEAAITGTAQAGYARVKLMWEAAVGATYSIYRAESEGELSSAEAISTGITVGSYSDPVGDGAWPWYRIDTLSEGKTVSGTPFRAEQETGFEALQESAIINEVFTDTVFDGSRVVDLTSKLDQVKNLTAGSVVIQFKYTGPVNVGGASDTAGPYSTLFGVGVGNTTENAQLAFYGAKQTNSQLRFILPNGMKTNANVGKRTDDGSWHTAILTTSPGLICSALDGTTGDGTYKKGMPNWKDNWDGFFSKISAKSFGVGGIPGDHHSMFANWVGNIAYFIVTDETLTEAQAQAITAPEQTKRPLMTLRGNAVPAGRSGAVVGTLSLSGNIAAGATMALAAPASDNDNASFKLEGDQLITSVGLPLPADLTTDMGHTVAVNYVVNGAVEETFSFTVKAMDGERPFYRYDHTGSGWFRIPALMTLNNGDIMAAIDARFSGPADSPANLDTAVNFNRGSGWELARLINNFEDYPNKDSERGTSASFIDPQIIQLPATSQYPDRILMLVDAYPYSSGIGTLPNNSYNGMMQVDDAWYLALTTGNREDFPSFAHYLKPNPGATKTGTEYVVYQKSDHMATEYTTDASFNLYKNGVAQTTVQKESGVTVAQNLFYDTSPLQVYPTSYLWLVHSDDNGETWSSPRIIGNEQRSARNGNFLGCGPGRGHVVQGGAYQGRVMFSLYDEGYNDSGTGNRNERASVLYSDNGGDTWTLGKRTTMATANGAGKSSEAQIVELPDGTLRMYARSSVSCIGYTDSVDGGQTWEPMVQDIGLPYGGGGSGCQISAINYSKTVDGKPALLVAAPGGSGRANGVIYVGLIEEHSGTTGMGKYTVDWKYKYAVNGVNADEGVGANYSYSCLTELEDGRIALLYEVDTNDNTIPGASIGYQTYRMEELTRGGLVSLSVTGTPLPGADITVELTLNKAIDLGASSLTPGLTIQYPGTAFAAGVLAYREISADQRVLTFAGTLPSATKGYHYQISIPSALVLRSTDGARVRFPSGGQTSGTVGNVPLDPVMTVTARYLSNRIEWLEGASLPTSYELQRGVSATGSFTTLATFRAGETTYNYVDEAAGTGTQYYYRLVLTGSDKTTIPIQASHPTGLDTLLETAVLSKIYTTDKEFNGSRIEVLADGTTNPDAFQRVRAMGSGTIVTMAKLTGTQPTAYTAILGSNTADCFIGIHNSGGSMRFAFGGNKAAVTGSSYGSAGYHTGVYTYDATTAIAAMDGYTVNYSLANAFYGGVNGLSALTVGGNSPDATIRSFTGKLAYVLITAETLSMKEAIALSKSTNFPDADPNPDYTDGEKSLGMFQNGTDDTWAFAGGRSAQGSIADLQGARNYIGQFEEYIRWQLASVSGAAGQIARQRYTVNTARAGETIQTALRDFDARIVPLDPKAVVYLVGQEDWSKGQGGLNAFQSSLSAFLAKARALKGGEGLVVVQTPYALAKEPDNANAALYAKAVKDVVAGMTALERTYIVVVDHYTQTNTPAFKTTCLNADGMLNAKGHLELGRALSVAVYGSANGYPNSTPGVEANFPNDLTPVATPKSYLTTPAVVTASADSLRVVVPSGVAVDSWSYDLEINGFQLSGKAWGKTFTITGLPGGASYTLTLTGGDNHVRLPVMTGTVKSGASATVRSATLTAQQQLLAKKVAGSEPLTWLFMGDSITHGAKWLKGYDSIAQSMEKFIKDDLGRGNDIVINTANSSATSQDTVNHLRERLTKYDADVVSVLLGTNDANNKTVPVETYKANLETILTAIEAKGAVAILHTPLPSTSAGLSGTLPDYVAACKEVAKAHPNAILVDQSAVWSEWLSNMPFLQGKLYGDAIHPNATGQLVMTRQFLKDTGLWRDDSSVCNLFYDLGLTKADSLIQPTLTKTDNSISVDAAALSKAYGSDLALVTLSVLDETGRTYRVAGSGTLTLSSLPANGSYTVTVAAQCKDADTAVTFPSQTIQLGDVIEAAGQVKKGDGSPASGLTVTLMRGATTAITDTTGADGTFTLSAPAGAYMLVVTVSEGHTVSQAVMLPSTLLEVTLPEGNLGTSVTVAEDGMPSVSVGGLASLFTEEEKKSAKEDASYRVSYELAVAQPRVEEEIQAILTQADGKTISTMLNITLEKTTQTTTTPVPTASSLLQVQIPLDTAWKGQVLTIYRYHNKAVDVLSTKANEQGEYFDVTERQLILHVKNFSTYAVAYAAPDTPSPDGGTNSGGSVRYKLTASAEGSGTITPAIATAVKGGSVTVTITPNEGNLLHQLLLDGVAVMAAGPDANGIYTYTLKNIQANHTLKAVFLSAEADVLVAFGDLKGHWAMDSIRWAVEQGLMKGTSATTFSPDDTTTRATVATLLYRMAGEPETSGVNQFTDVPQSAWYAKAVLWAAEQGVIKGVGDSTFQPDSAVSRQELAVLFQRYAQFLKRDATGTAAGLDSYADHAQISDWAREAMAWCVDSGILKGAGNALMPGGKAARSELAVMLQRLSVWLEQNP